MKPALPALAGLLLVAACGSSGKVAGSSTTSASTTTTVATTVGPTTTAPQPTTTVATTVAPTTVAPTTAPTTTPTTSTSSSSTTASACAPFGGTGAVNVNIGHLSSLVGQNIRTGAQACFERVVIDLTQSTLPIPSPFPGYGVGWVPNPVTLSPSDQRVTIKGGAVLLVTMDAWMPTMDNQGYTGPQDLFPTNVTKIQELRQVQNFEGVTTWAIGVDTKRNFRVSTLSGPPRLVIDIQTSP
jgi:hypothetical protein